MFISCVMFVSTNNFTTNQEKMSPILTMVRVVVVALKKRGVGNALRTKTISMQ